MSYYRGSARIEESQGYCYIDLFIPQIGGWRYLGKVKATRAVVERELRKVKGVSIVPY